MRFCIAFTLLILLSACSGLKHVPQGELLYTGAKIKLVYGEKMRGKAAVKSGAKKAVRPKPNTSFLGMRPRLWIYFNTREPKKPKGIRNWIKYKLGQPPVYLSHVDIPFTTKAIDAGLYNNGFFDSFNQAQVKEGRKDKTASLQFALYLRPPYIIEDVNFPAPTDTLRKLIARSGKKTLIKEGQRYRLDELQKERERIDNSLKRRGYYYFRPDYLLFTMDTHNRKAWLHLDVKSNTPEKALHIYHIADVNIYPNYGASDTAGTQLLITDSVHYYKGSNYIHPRTVLRSVFYRPRQTYSSRIHDLTLARLSGLGVFKFINVDLSDTDTNSSHLLSVNILLTPLPRKAVSVELQAYTKSNNFIGPGVNFTFRNRNTFKGAELFIFNLRASLETQYSGQYRGLFTYEINPRIELNVPRMLVPFKVRSHRRFIPLTTFRLEYAYLSRVGYFDMNTAKFSFGYKWKTIPEIDHELLPVNVTFYNIYNKSDRFNQLISENALIRSRFRDQYIPGITYSFFYNEQVRRQRRNQFYFNANVELAGNMAWLFSRVINGQPSTAEAPAKLLGVAFAQFARLDVDIRNYFRASPNSTLAARFIAGWGKAYGNAATLPYARQFFTGGAYSLRGFPGNSVGPGGYTPPDSIRNVFYLQQGGEIKLELNVEYRFPIIWLLKGAVFIDAGNNWLNKPSPDAPLGEIRWNRFMKEIALSTGAGLRLDLDFFVIRLDVGIPLRNPALPENQRWQIERLRFSNVLFNLAFGYPF